MYFFMCSGWKLWNTELAAGFGARRSWTLHCVSYSTLMNSRCRQRSSWELMLVLLYVEQCSGLTCALLWTVAAVRGAQTGSLNDWAIFVLCTRRLFVVFGRQNYWFTAVKSGTSVILIIQPYINAYCIMPNTSPWEGDITAKEPLFRRTCQ